MLESLIRNWIAATARQKLQEAARQAAAQAGNQAAQADRAEPPAMATPGVCHAGVVFALSIESGVLVDRLDGAISVRGAGFVAREGGLGGRRVAVIESGVGRPAAARATENLILGHRPRWVITAGFAGGLDERMKVGEILVADQIVNADGQRLDIDLKLEPPAPTAERRWHVGRLLTSDRVVAEPAQKRACAASSGALAVDMESWAVADVCRQSKTRCLAVRVISDTVDQQLPSDLDYLIRRKTAAGRIGAAAGAILRRPSSLKDMWKLKEDALVASQHLADFLAGLIGQLPV